MESDKNYFLVGLFVIVMAFAGLGFTLWLTSSSGGDYNYYRIRFAESVSGLVNQSVVKFRGVNVGNVEAMGIDPKNSKIIIVDIRVLDTTPVKPDTTATLKLAGITGDLYVELSGGDDAAPIIASANPVEPAEIKAEPSSINAILNGLPQIVEKANHIADQLSKLFSDSNVKAVNKAVKGVSSFFGSDDEEEKEKEEAPRKNRNKSYPSQPKP